MDKKLNTIAVFYFVLAGLSLLGILFIFAHYLMLNSTDAFGLSDDNKSLEMIELIEEMKATMVYVYLIIGAISIFASITALTTGLCIMSKKNRKLAIVGAAIWSIWIPFGTVLGVFALLMLFDDEVINEFDLIIETQVP